jgi:putative restriction endonuclease
MKSEGFWHLHAVPGQEAVVEAMRVPNGVGFLMANVAYVSLDNDLFGLISQPASREILRLAIIDRYFSKQRKAIFDLCSEERSIGKIRKEWRDSEYRVGRGDTGDVPQNVRSAAFARTVRSAYDYTCAACGIRFRYENVTLIDAAHLIPFSEMPDNSPQNGLALCKNHHWLMDCNMLAPGPGRGNNYKKPCWHVNKGLDDRISEQRELLKLNKRPLLLPNDNRLWPKPEALDCRMEMLLEAC